MEQLSRFPIFRTRFRDLMWNLHMSATEFADYLGLSRQTVGFYLNGNRIPDILTLTQICNRCSVSADWLLGLSVETSPDQSIQGACIYTGLSGPSIKKIHDLPYGLRDIVDEIINNASFHEMLWLISNARRMREEFAENESEIAGETERGDDEVSAAQEFLDEHFIAAVDYELASKLYIEHAKTIFGRIIDQEKA